MSQLEAHRRSPRKRVLITTFHYDREFSMESRLTWHRAQHAASEYDVTVICAYDERNKPRAADEMHERPIEVVELPLTRWEQALMRSSPTHLAGYRRWHGRVYEHAKTLHAERPFAIVHHMSFCGFREPSDGWRLGPPFVWGPIGGTHGFPMQFRKELGLLAVLREAARNHLNRRQLLRSPRVRQAGRAAAAVFAANQQASRELQPTFGAQLPVQLETGVSPGKGLPRQPLQPGEPLRILWSGRLRPWKALPLLLKALAALPKDCEYQLRVLGEGPCLKRWQRVASKLGVAPRVEWAGWPKYSGQLAHYAWADVLAFTSLRDTSGTGLLEALAAGAPILGVDHQGVADVMTEQCAIRVPATDPAATIAGYRAAIMRLTTEPDLLPRLSRGALDRAKDFDWSTHWDVMRQVYRRALNDAGSAGSLDADASSGGDIDMDVEPFEMMETAALPAALEPVL